MTLLISEGGDEMQEEIDAYNRLHTISQTYCPVFGAKKPITKTQHGQHSDLKRWCPSCKERLYRKTDRCQNCGQEIKWK